MGAPQRMTWSAAKAEVLRRVGQYDDGVSDPVKIAKAGAMVNAATAALRVEYPFLRLTRLARKTLAGGQRLVDLPGDADEGAIVSATLIQDGERYVLQCGIDRREQSDVGSMPLRYDLRPTTAVVNVDITAAGSGFADGPVVVTVSGGLRDTDGADAAVSATAAGGVITAVAIDDSGAGYSLAPTLTPVGGTATLTAELGGQTALEIWPNATGGELELVYRARVEPLTADADALPMDAEAVIGRAAWLFALPFDQQLANALLLAHQAYVGSYRTQATPGRSASLSAWRRDGWEYEPLRNRRDIMRW